MLADEVAQLYSACEAAGAGFWIDGGWAIDALVGQVTRPHDDLDIAVEARRLEALTAILEQRGYVPVPSADRTDWNFVMQDAAGRRIDVHVIVFDEAGRGVLGPAERGSAYPPNALDGLGMIAGAPVRCVSAEAMFEFKTSYRPRPQDITDVRTLSHLLGRPVPAGY